ncbi:MAG: alpha/beta fold hydrolase [Sandaracinaceae bacterium]
MTEKQGRIRANGIDFAFIEEGEGPLVLMLHGFPDTAHTWDDLRPRLAAAGYRAVSPNTRGYHPTEAPREDPTQRTLGEDALALIEALGGGPAVLIGHDWGASAAYAAAALNPKAIRLLVTVAIPHPAAIRPTLTLAWAVRHFFFYKLPGAPARFAKNDFAALRKIYRRWSPRWELPPGELDPILESFSHPESLNAAFGYYRRAIGPPPSFLKNKIQVPTVSFAGTDDPVLTPAHYEAARRKFAADYTVETMPGGHFLHREHPTRFAELLMPHLAQ